MAERYERGSMLITSNLVFSEWNKIFKDPMTNGGRDRPCRPPFGDPGVCRGHDLPRRSGGEEKGGSKDQGERRQFTPSPGPESDDERATDLEGAQPSHRAVAVEAFDPGGNRHR